MKEGQDKIYYLLAPSLAAAKSSPHLETFNSKGIEVLLLTEDIDNWLVGSLRDFEGKRLQSVAQGAADLARWRTKQKPRPRNRRAPSSPTWWPS